MRAIGCVVSATCRILRVLLIGSMLLVAMATAQESRGAIGGKVTDEQGGALPGALVELQPRVRSLVSDGQGQFTIAGLTPGTYTISVSYVGFSRFSASVTVTSGQSAQIDAKL